MNKVNTAEDGAPASAETMSSERLAQLREEVSKLKVTGGMANPERLAGKWGIGLTIFGFVVAIVVVVERVQRGQLRRHLPIADLRRYRYRHLDRRHRPLDPQLAHALLPLLAHSPRLRAARADRPVDRGVGARAQLTSGESQAPARSRNATSLSTRGSPGRPSTRSPITLR